MTVREFVNILIKSAVNIILFCLLIFSSAPSQACPEALREMETEFLGHATVCEIHDRYHEALKALRSKGVENPERIGNLMAPRFINRPDWLKKRDSLPASAWMIYKPGPLTWLTWDKAVRFVDDEAAANYLKMEIRPYSLNWLRALHQVALQGLAVNAGVFRNHPEVGLALCKDAALTESNVRAIHTMEWKTIATRTENKLLSFQPTVCLEDQTSEFQRQFQDELTNGQGVSLYNWQQIDPEKFFVASDGTKRQCGYIRYSAEQEVQPQLEKWLDFVT